MGRLFHSKRSEPFWFCPILSNVKTVKAVLAHRPLLQTALSYVTCHMSYITWCIHAITLCPTVAIPAAHLPCLSILTSVKHSLNASLPVSPICPSLCPIYPRCLGLTAVLLRTQDSRVMLPVHVYRQSPYNLPLAFGLTHILFSSCRQKPLLPSHPKGVLAALKLQLQRRIRAGVIP